MSALKVFKWDIIAWGMMVTYGKKWKVMFSPPEGGDASVTSGATVKDVTDIVGIGLSVLGMATPWAEKLMGFVGNLGNEIASGVGKGVTFGLGVFKAGVGYVIVGMITAYLKQFSNLMGAISWGNMPVDPPADQDDLPHNTTANISATADLTGTTMDGTVYTGHLSVDGSTGVAGGWASSINHSFDYDSVLSSSASVYDSTGSLIGSGSISAVPLSPMGTIEGHASYNFTGTGLVTAHATSAPGVAVTADIGSYTGVATRTTGSLTITLAEANVTIGSSSYTGAVTIVCNAATIKGGGALGFGHHVTSVEIPSMGSNLTLGDYTGTLKLGGTTIGSGGSLSFTNFRGNVTVSSHNATA
ncbi:MAG: hypothetical protein KAQ96_02480, partial [Thermoplasmata archaeon]|nr:hypothetical protein [Thermoplasmata archaeon]